MGKKAFLAVIKENNNNKQYNIKITKQANRFQGFVKPKQIEECFHSKPISIIRIHPSKYGKQSFTLTF